MTDSPNPPAQLGGQAIGRPEALAKASGPGIALMAVGGIGLFWNVINILWNLFATGAIAMGNSGDGMGIALLSGGVGIAFAVLASVFNLVMVFGGLKMKNLESHGLAMAAAIVAILPCSACCLIGIPVGIWAITVLTNQDVKAQFR